MASKHPRLPLTKYFFCPGFNEASGGLIRETHLPLQHPLSRERERERVGVRVPDAALRFGGDGVDASTALTPAPLPPTGEGFKADEIFDQGATTASVFIFAYPHAPVQALVQGFATAGVPAAVTLAAPVTQSNPEWQTAAPVAQTEFDALLAGFDFLIVRGEDSFVRAQWAAKPLLWHIYPTDDGAHSVKLDAWLDHYCIGLEANANKAYRSASHAFNAATGATAQSAPYELLAQHIDVLTAHAVRWRDALMQQTDLATRLMAFVAAHCDTHKAKNLG